MVGVTAAILVLTLTPMPQTATQIPGSDKLYHFVAFCALALPVYGLRRKWQKLGFLCAVLLGCVIEIVQPSVGRTASIGDLFADLAGVTAGLLLGRLLFARRELR